MRRTDSTGLTHYLQSRVSGAPRVVVSGNHAVPWSALAAVDSALEHYRLFVLNAPAGVPDRDGVTLETPFVGAGMRGRPSLAYFPSRLSLVPALLRRATPPDVVIVHTAPPRDGLLSLGIEVNILPAAVEAARARGGLVIAQINQQMPYTVADALLRADDVDLAIDVDTPLDELRRPALGEVQQRIGEHIARLVPDAATLQLGIGGIPDAAIDQLLVRRGLRVWSEMISDGVLRLEKVGALAGDVIVTSFAAGSAELYDWLDGNSRVAFCRTERTNDPSVIARQSRMTSINAALQVDLFAQANASYVNGQIYSGFGGQTDFVVGALHASDGQAIIALPSWHAATDTSTIVDHLRCPATSFQHSAVVTERGVATIWGKSQHDQALQLIEHAAAPSAHQALLTSLGER